MIIGSALKVYMARERVDLRKSWNGLSLLVQEVLKLDPLSGHLFVFFNKRLDKVKVLYWDHNGFCLWQKRLEQERFRLWSFAPPYLTVNVQEFQMLLQGIDLRRLPARQNFNGCVVG
jgi:transposase